MTERKTQTVFPLMFGFNDLVLGRGFVAEVSTNGRATMTQDDGQWWMSGVNPGGVASPGATVPEALAAFRQSYRLVLQDSAMLTNSFDEFTRNVQAIFSSTSPELVEEWKAAAMAIRAGATAGPFDELQRRPCDNVTFSVTIREVIVEKAQPKPGPEQEFCVPLPLAA